MKVAKHSFRRMLAVVLTAMLLMSNLGLPAYAENSSPVSAEATEVLVEENDSVAAEEPAREESVLVQEEEVLTEDAEAASAQEEEVLLEDSEVLAEDAEESAQEEEVLPGDDEVLTVAAEKSAQEEEVLPGDDEVLTEAAEESAQEEEVLLEDDDFLTDETVFEEAADAAEGENLMAQPSEALLTATSPITTWAELQDALSYGGSAVLGADLTAGDEDGTLVVPAGIQVTLNLNGHIIRFPQRTDESVKVEAAIRNEGTLNLIDSEDAGEIYIQGFSSWGHGLLNKDTLTISDVVIGRDFSDAQDGAITIQNEENATLTVSGTRIDGGINNKGVMNVSGNMGIPNGVILANRDPIHIIGQLGEDTLIKVAAPYEVIVIVEGEEQEEVFELPLVATDGLATYGEPEYFASVSSDDYGMDINEDGEAFLDYAYTVSFDSNGGSAVATQHIMNNHPAVEPEDPTRENMVFKGWLLNDEPYDFAAPVTRDITLVAKWITPWAELQEKINQGGTITLDADVIAQYGDVALVVPQGVTVTLDLNGHSIDRNGEVANSDKNPAMQIFGELTLEDSSEGGAGKITGANSYVSGGGVYNGGRFTMNGGTITGNKTATGGGVCNGGTFIMNGGTISQNVATASGGGVANYSNFTLNGGTITGNEAIEENGSTPHGGGVNNEGDFTMTGGTISENHSRNDGGGVANYSNFTMTGGTISGNDANGAGGGVCNLGTFIMTDGLIRENYSAQYLGDGVYTRGTFRLSGKPLIYLNGRDNTTDVYLAQGCFIDVVGELDPQIQIGVAMDEPGVITRGLPGNGSAENFVAQPSNSWDNKHYGVDLNEDGEAVMVQMYLVTFNVFVKNEWRVLETRDVRPGHTTTPLEIDEATYAPTQYNGNVVFGGWERQNSETGEPEPFDFNTPVTSDLDLYDSWISRWADFQKTLNAGGEITLTRSLQAWEDDDSLVIPEGVEVTLDLNGFTLDRNGTEDAPNRTPAIVVNGTLSLKDSSADGSGKITGANSSVPGGGVYVSNSGTFTMLSGIIIGNTAAEGSGVYNDGVFTMTGGSINYDLTSPNGVYNNGKFRVSGKPLVSEVYLTRDKVIELIAPLDASVQIGVKMQRTGVFTQGLPGNGTIDNFANQTNTLAIKLNDAGEAYLQPGIKVTIDPGNGELPVSTMIDGGDTVEKPADAPVWANHVFQGWYELVDGEFAEEPFDFTTEIFENTTIMAKWATAWEELQEQIDNAQGSTIITLTQNVTAEKGMPALEVPLGIRVTIDLNGFTIDRALTTAAADGYVIKVAGTLTLRDSVGTGKITGGNNADFGGGVIVEDGGKFTLESGTITGNSAYNVGGVNVLTNGEFIMKGGTITENTATDGLAVGVSVGDAKFTMTGGSITQEIAGDGDNKYIGVYMTTTNSEFEISGSPVIHVGGGYGLYFTEAAEDWRIDVPGKLTSDASIEVYIDRLGVFTDGLNGNGTAANFLNQNESLMMDINSDGEAWLAVPVTVHFDSDGGSEVEAQVLMPGKTATKPEAPTKEGYVFMGWQLDGADYDFETPVNADITLKANWITNWAYLQQRIDDAENGATITLEQNTTATAEEAAITVPADKTVTIDLNGHTIDRARTAAEADGQVITVKGNLTVTDSVGTGKITGGWTTTSGGGVYVEDSGKFTLESGAISGNQANFGGGVYGNFTMNGGEISGNSAMYGGGVYCDNSNRFTLTGGSITDNTATSNMGGGVYSGGSTFSLSGDPVIKDNKDANGNANNVQPESEITIAGKLADTAVIGVTKPALGVFTKNLSGKGTAANFTSDDSAYIISTNDKGEAQLVEPVTVTFDSDGGSEVEPQKLAVGDKAQKPEDPTKEGFTFKEWTLDGEAYDFDKIVTANITLKAVWENTPEETVVIKSANVDFQGQIQLQFTLSFPESVLSDEGAYVNFEKAEKTTKKLVSEGTENEGNVTFAIPVSAPEYADDIVVKVYGSDDNQLSLKSAKGTDYTTDGFVYSVKTYAQNKIQNGSTEEIRNLAKALNDYGTVAQIYFSYGDYSGLTVDSAVTAVTLEDLAPYALTTSGTKPSGVTGAGISVVFDEDNTLRITFKTDGSKALTDYTFLLDGEETAPTKSGKNAYLYVKNIAAPNLDTQHTFTVTDGTDTYTVTASALSYAYTSVKNGTEARQNLGKALYLYNQAGNRYFSD